MLNQPTEITKVAKSLNLVCVNNSYLKVEIVKLGPVLGLMMSRIELVQHVPPMLSIIGLYVTYCSRIIRNLLLK
jgi:hypothetical protein